jgi:tight adherence protein B
VIDAAGPAVLIAAAWVAIAFVVRGRGSPILSIPAPRDEGSPPTAQRGLRVTIVSIAGSRAAWVTAGAVVGWAVAGPVAAAVTGFLAGVARGARVRRSERRRVAAIDDGMADGVRAIAAGLRAGLSVPQALRFAADEATPPLDATLAAVVDAADVGEPLDDALRRWAAEVGTPDARLVQGVLGLHRRSGGDLPRVLDRVAETLRDRRAIAREVRALTAQARLSGAILGLLPIAFFAFLWLTSRSDIEGAFRTPAGLAALGVGAVLELLAFVWIRRLLEVR